MKACLSPVAPRVISPATGEVVPLVDQIEGLLSRGRPAQVQVSGEGSRAAIQHLMAACPESIARGELFVKEAGRLKGHGAPMVTVSRFQDARDDLVLRLAAWTRDDVIEYLLSQHPSKCQNVMSRLNETDFSFARGSSFVWRMILDELASDESIPTVESAINAILCTQLGDQKQVNHVADALLVSQKQELALDDLDALSRQLLSYLDVAQRLADRRFSQLLSESNPARLESLLARFWPRFRLLQLVSRLSGQPTVRENLVRAFADGKSKASANSATLLCQTDSHWRPECSAPMLCGSCLKGAKWSGIQLDGANLVGASLVGADLRRATIVDASLSRTDFSRACLRQARLGCSRQLEVKDQSPDPSGDQGSAGSPSSPAHRCRFAQADLTQTDLSDNLFSEADFSDANLSQAIAHRSEFLATRFDNADLSDADLSGSVLRNCSLRDAALDHAFFSGVTMEAIDLDDQVASAVDFANANLRGSSFTGSSLTGCCFHKTDLRGARLAEINWVDCDLREADLRGATFHMGSTRCGLVGSPYPSHGTRTGFYTDEFEEQYFKRPEEIRKANLMGADLRGAKLDNVDFYLVDLRCAALDLSQRKQLVATGAILN
ncbi:MAG: pentapeptide repeat-containing protein [Planctomycetota bacterium]